MHEAEIKNRVFGKILDLEVLIKRLVCNILIKLFKLQLEAQLFLQSMDIDKEISIINYLEYLIFL